MTTGIPVSEHAAAGEAKRMIQVKKNQAEAKIAKARFKLKADAMAAAEKKRAATMLKDRDTLHAQRAAAKIQ